MRCFGSFKDDRICELCLISNEKEYNECKSKHEIKINTAIKLEQIKRMCPHLTECWDEYTRFDACNKDDKAYGRFAPSCKVCLECEKYSKQEME